MNMFGKDFGTKRMEEMKQNSHINSSYFIYNFH